MATAALSPCGLEEGAHRNDELDGVSPLSGNALDAVGVCKRFRFRSSTRQTTLKDLVVRRVRVEKRYGVVDALDDVTFSVRRGQTLGVIGENGSGKSTLLRVLAGITKPDRGEVRVRGSVAPLLSLGTGFNAELTGRENALIELLMLGLSRAQARSHLQDVIDFSELSEFIDAPMRTYSSGMGMRLGFAVATRVDPEILLIDEVLSVGDERFAVKCAAWLDDFKRRGKTTVLVTHSTPTVASQCDVALWLHRGRGAAFGAATDVVHAYLQAMREQGPDGHAYNVGVPELLPVVRLPLIGHVRQEGPITGTYDDGWTDGSLEFAFEPLRDVRGWTIRATIPVGMPESGTLSAEIDGRLVASAGITPGEMLLRCEMHVAGGRSAKMRITSSPTVNHRTMGISGDVRDIGARIDEIVFDH
ncbi:MAG: ABC transporter ATP-binding protein [Steroidobacteraceae bacterium]